MKGGQKNIDKNAKVIIIYSLNPAGENNTLRNTQQRLNSRTFLFPGCVSNAAQVGSQNALHQLSRPGLPPRVGVQFTQTVVHSHFPHSPLWGAPSRHLWALVPTVSASHCVTLSKTLALLGSSLFHF